MNNEWISVKDRLPEKEGYYICTCRWDENKAYDVDLLKWSKNISPRIVDFLEDRIFDNGGAFGEMWPDGLDNLMEVIAWMPVPDVYKEDEVNE